MMKNFPYDKSLHFLAGFIISTLVYAITGNTVYGLYAAAFAGLMKEVRD